MIEKYLEFTYGDNGSEVFSLVHPGHLEKRAEYSDELQSYINNMKAKKNKVYALVNALGAGEKWGSNKNGDYFPEKALKEYHKTFEALAGIYTHHVNKNPEKSLGKVLFSHYNSEMHRVELILELDESKAADIIKRLKNNELPSCSMGCKVPYDECSVCHNKAKSRTEYCEHLKTQMNKILPDGRKVYALNTMPKFFDISIVTIPADPTAGFLHTFKNLPVEEDTSIKKLAFLDNYDYIKVAEKQKTGEMSKTIGDPVAIDSMNKDPKKLLTKRLKRETLKKCAEYSFDDILSTFLGLRIMPCPEDFQKLAFYCAGNYEVADELESKNIVFGLSENTVETIPDNVSLNNFNEKIAEICLDEIKDISLTKELVVARQLEKMAQTLPSWQPSQPPAERSLLGKVFFGNEEQPRISVERNPIVPLGLLGGLYYGFTKIFNNPSTGEFRSFMIKNPWLLPLLIGGGTVGTLWAQNRDFVKTASSLDKFMRNSLIGFPISYYMSAKYQKEAEDGIPISGTKNFIRNHPALTALLASLLGVKAENLINKGLTKVGEFISKLPENNVNQIYKELIQTN